MTVRVVSRGWRGAGVALALLTGADVLATPDAVDAALSEAQVRRQPVVVEFAAPWCYSCYYMAQHVHTGAEWAALHQRARVVALDADSPSGAARMQAWKLKALPSYVVLGADGRERGRILGEQTRADFYARMDALTGRGGLEALQASAARGKAKGLLAVRASIGAFHARSDAGAGIQWFFDLPGRVRQPYERDPAVALGLDRLRLMSAAQAGDAPACARIATELTRHDPGCERPQDLARLLSCTGDGRLALAARGDALLAQLAPMEKLVEHQVFGSARRCADERSAVVGLGQLYEAIGERARREPLIRRAADDLALRMGPDLAADRNRADNLRLYLELLAEIDGDWGAHDALLPRMVAAWPDDYVYAFRYGRSLLERDRASEALPYLERAAARAYGQNRLKVAEQQVKALKRLGRGDDARSLGAEVLEANGPWFKEDAARLRAQL